MFKVALILVNICLRSKVKSASALKKQYPTMYETLEALRNPPVHLLEEDFIVRNVSFPIIYYSLNCDKFNERKKALFVCFFQLLF